MKFIHLSDVRLLDTRESGYDWGQDTTLGTWENFLGFLNKAEEEDVDLIMITGGLFDHIPVESDLVKVGDIFAQHHTIETVIIAGGSDALIAQSPVRSFVWPDNVHYVLEPRVKRISLSRIYTEVYAASQVDGKSADPKEYCEKAQELVESEGLKLAMYRPMRFEDADIDAISKAFSGSEFSYVAIGGPSKYREISKNFIFSSGSLEALNYLDTGKHGYIKGEIPFESGSPEIISFEEMSSLRYVTLNIKINSRVSAKEVCDSIEEEIKRRGENNIYSLNISGMRKPEEKLDFEGLKRDFRILKVTDATRPEYDYGELFKEHSQDMIGFFISNVAEKRDKMSKVEEKAMFYGIDALISTKDAE